MHDLKPISLLAHRPQLPRKDTYVYHVISFISLYCLSLSFIFFLYLSVRLAGESLFSPYEVQALHNPVVEASPAPTVLAVASPSPEPSQSPTEHQADPIQEREQIRQYIKTIFGRESETAYAISLAEGKARNLYKGEVVYDVNAVRKTEAEYSVGIFQINLKSEYAKVHFDRVPGQTIEDKAEWLKNPYNNTLFAYWVYSTSSFAPWTTYSEGKYLAYIK